MARSPRRTLPVLLLSTSLLAQTFPAMAAPAAGGGKKGMLGFSAAREAEQRELEARFDASLKAENLREWMKRFTEHAHHVGSPWGKQNAEFALGLFRSWGYDAQIETFRSSSQRRRPASWR